MVLGALHGPGELLPVSSSAHTTVIPWLAGSPYAELDPELRKTFEVALHAGAIAALVFDGDPSGPPNRRRLAVIVAATLPAAFAGYLLEEPIEARLGTPTTIAAGLLAGGLAMGLADRSPQRRSAEEADAVDGLWLGLAQATALVPGISRSGATLAAARWRRFTRPAAAALSRQLAYPVIGGATALKAWRLAQQRGRQAPTGALAAGAAVSFISTLVTARALRGRTNALTPFAIYRAALAALILRRRDSTARRRRPARP